MHASHVAATYRKGRKGSGSPRPQRVESAGKKQRKSSGKGQGSLGWVQVTEDSDASCWVLGRKGEEYGDMRSHDTAIVSGSLFARAVPSTSLDVGDHLPRRPDSMLLHPDTMHLCGFAIAQPVAVRCVATRKPSLVVCKPWPFKKIYLDAVALSPLVLQSCVNKSGEAEEGEGEGEGEGRVEVWRIPNIALLPAASEVHLSPCSSIEHSALNASFKSYICSIYDGLFVCKGNVISVLFCNEDVDFTVERVIPVGQALEPKTGTRLSFNTSGNLTTLLEDSLRLDIAELCLETGDRGRHHGSPLNSPARMTSLRCRAVTSTPGMEIDEAPTHSGMESRQVDSPILKPNVSAYGEENNERSILLEQQMKGLGLNDSEAGRDGGGRRGMSWCQASEGGGGEDEEVPVEVVVCKITMKTKIVFTECDHRKGSKSCDVDMADIGGLSAQKQLLTELIVYPLQNPSLDGIQFPNGVLLHGPSGVGKSLLARAVSSVTLAHTLTLCPSDLSSDDSATRLQSLFKEARDTCPSLVLLDDVHSLCTATVTTASLAACLDALHTTPPPRHVVVVATTNQIEAVDSVLRRPGRFDREIEVTTPSAVERREILEVLLRGVPHCVETSELVSVADSAHGYTGSDLRAVCMQAQHRALRRKLESEQREGEEGEEGGVVVRGEDVRSALREMGGVVVRGEDVRSALREVRPSAMREVTVEVPKVLWSDIGGQEDVKRRLREAVEWPLHHPEAFLRLGISPPKGVLLYGPPGCSKTMIARALATESGLNFIAVKGPELFSKWVGDSERAVRQVFRRARAAAPAIIFFDEIDALAVQRKSDGSSVADRVLAQLLTEMDGVEILKDVLIVAATNRPDMIDKALLRPGRIDRLIYVPLPSDDTRREIFQIKFRSTPVDNDVSLDELVSRTQGFSGAEVVALCQEAALCAMHEDLAVKMVYFRHFQQALKTITPQAQTSTIAAYEHYSKSLALQ